MLQAAYVRTIPTSVVRFTRRRIKPSGYLTLPHPFRSRRPRGSKEALAAGPPQVEQPPTPKPNCAQAHAGGASRGQVPQRSECPNRHQSQGRAVSPASGTTKKASPVFTHSGRATRGLSLPREGAWIATEIFFFSPKTEGELFTEWRDRPFSLTKTARGPPPGSHPRIPT